MKVYYKSVSNGEVHIKSVKNQLNACLLIMIYIFMDFYTSMKEVQ